MTPKHNDSQPYPCGHCRVGTMEPTGAERCDPDGGNRQREYACTHCPHTEWKPAGGEEPE